MTTDSPQSGSAGPESGSARIGVSTKTFGILAAFMCLALAGVASYYASDSPDGLNRVATDQGLAEKEEASATSSSPLAGYSTDDVANDRVSGGIAGVVGVTVVLVVAGGLAYVVRRRSTSTDS